MPRLRFLRPPLGSKWRVFLAAGGFELVVVFVATKKQRVVLTGVLVLGAGAIGFDQLTGETSAPQAAKAEELLIASEKSPTSVQTDAAADRSSGTHVKSVAQMLNVLPTTWNPEAPATDANGFALPAHWVSKIVEKPAPVSAHPQDALAAAVEPELHLTMIVGKAKEPSMAIINGEPVRVGESVQGYTLLSLRAPGEGGKSTSGLAVLEGPSGRKELIFDPAAPSNTRGRGNAKQ